MAKAREDRFMQLEKSGTVVITGADGALGGAAFKHFATQGLHVIGTAYTAHSVQSLTKTAESNRWSTEVHQLDLGSHKECQTFAEKITGAHPQIKLLFNAAGGFRYTSTVDCSQKDFEFLMQANFYSCWHLAKFFVPKMQKQDSGRIVFVSSRKTQEAGQANFGIYTASKAALDAMVRGLADELKGSKLTVNLIAPTVIDTPANRNDMPGADTSKWVTTDDILNAVEFLISKAAGSVNGSTIVVGGGL
jgi:NAD(P)-dependent dehydrogenase (short-subunit alcohol dehydrogenase family)